MWPVGEIGLLFPARLPEPRCWSRVGVGSGSGSGSRRARNPNKERKKRPDPPQQENTAVSKKTSLSFSHKSKMAMAALRFTTRRLLAGQSRLAIFSAAAADEQRRLLPTLIHGDSSAFSRRFASSKHTAANAPKINTKPHLENKSRQMLLGQKKEELYNLLAEVNDEVPGIINRQQNKRLLANLSLQVEPRPNDRRWLVHRAQHWVSFGLTSIAFFITGIYAAEKYYTRENNY